MRPGISIVELGAGTGVFTREILSKMPADGRLISYEINSIQAEFLRQSIGDKRLLVLEDSAAYLAKSLENRGIKKVDYIVSGLPLGIFDRESKDRIIQEINNSLPTDGVYIQFQYFLSTLRKIKHFFDVEIIKYEVRNFPPAFVYKCRKKR